MRRARVALPLLALLAAGTASLWPHPIPPEPQPLDVVLPVLAAPTAAPLPGGRLDAAAVREALAPVLDDPALGSRVSAAVAAENGAPVWSRGGAITPASTTKLLTGLAALDTLDPAATFDTTVVRSGATITLVGGGDPLLARRPDPTAYPPRADLTTLAREAAARLGDQPVSLRYDATLFTGPAVNPHWPAGYVGNPGGYDVVAPTSALWVDEGHRPDSIAYVADPARTAAEVFAAALRAAGVTVRTIASGAAPAAATEIARVSSASVAQQVEHLLQASDNEAAEVMLRHVGLAAVGQGTTLAGLAGVRAALAARGIEAPIRQDDGSGLSRHNRVDPVTLLQVLQTGGALLDGLPVSGFSGTLDERFDQVPVAGRGVVRAKTGTLTGVSGLAGVGATADGVPFVFAVLADRIAPADTLEARAALDRAAAALALCTCGG